MILSFLKNAVEALNGFGNMAAAVRPFFGKDVFTKVLYVLIQWVSMKKYKWRII